MLSPLAPLIEHPAEWPRYEESAIREVTELVRAGRTFDYKHGRELAEFEELFSRLHEDRPALAVNSGTSALFAAYHALGLGPGDEVLVPTLTFLSTASPLLPLGATPVLCDSGGPDGNVTAETLRARITPRTKAIVVTHLFGHPCPMTEIMALAAEYGLPVVEDCSHAHGSTYRGRRVGTFGDLAAFSTGGLKLVSGGLGGVLLARSRRHLDLATLLANFQQRAELTVVDPALRRLADVGLGGNLRMSPVAAVLATSHLRRLDELLTAKQRNIGRLLDRLSTHDGVRGLPIAPERTMGAWYDAVFEVDEARAGFSRDELVTALRAQGVRARSPRTGPLHLTSVFSGDPAAAQVLRQRFHYRPQDLPVSVALHDRWISLPATFFNDPAGRLVEPYLRAIDTSLESLGRTHLRSAVPARRAS